MKPLILILISYLVGSIPFGVIIARSRGIDLRKYGSGNIGATNVLRTVGKKEALFTLLGDILKGTFAVVLARLAGTSEVTVMFCGLFSIIGHDFSIYLGFKGGKGVATSLGVLFGYAPVVGLLSVLVWIIVALALKYSSLAALVTFGLLPLFMITSGKGIKGFIFGLIISLLIFVKHRDNIIRLIKGTEPKIGHQLK